MTDDKRGSETCPLCKENITPGLHAQFCKALKPDISGKTFDESDLRQSAQEKNAWLELCDAVNKLYANMLKPQPASMGAREWTVEDLGFDGLWLSPKDGGESFDKERCPLHVIEHSAYESAMQQVRNCDVLIAQLQRERDEARVIAMNESLILTKDCSALAAENARLNSELEHYRGVMNKLNAINDHEIREMISAALKEGM